MTTVAPTEAPRTSETMQEVLKDVAIEIDLLNKNPDARGLRTGITRFDDYTANAFIPGAVVTIAGYSGGGKTAAIQQLALSFASQCWTHVVSLEDESIDAVKRMLANVSRLNVGDIRRGFAGRQIPDALDEAMAKIMDLPIEYDSVPGIDIWELVKRIGNRWKREGNTYGVVFVDQLSHVHLPRKESKVQEWAESLGWPAAPSGREPEHKQLEWMVEVLQACARHCGITIVLAHQLNNMAAETEKPTMRSIRASQGIVHKSESVFIFWVPQYILQENPHPGPGEKPTEKVPNELGQAWVLGVKQRKGETFELPLTFLGANQCFVDADGIDKPFTLPPARSEKAKAGSAALEALYKKRAQKQSAREAAVAKAEINPAVRAQIEQYGVEPRYLTESEVA